MPKENLLGEEGSGFVSLMMNLPQERLSIAAMAVAACERVLDLCLDYAKEREAFGRPIGKFQHNRFLLAEMATEAHIARVFVDDCVRSCTTPASSTPTLASMAKWWTTELQKKIVDQGVQLHGGYGYMTRVPDRQGVHGQPDPDDLRRHDRDPEGDHRPLAGDLEPAGAASRRTPRAAGP